MKTFGERDVPSYVADNRDSSSYDSEFSLNSVKV